MDDYVEAGIFYITECIHVSGISVTYLQEYAPRLLEKFSIYYEHKYQFPTNPSRKGVLP